MVNVEEGGEPSVPDGAARSESALTELGSQTSDVRGRDLAAESMFEYGSRVAAWRVFGLFASAGMPCTVFACAEALRRNPALCAEIRERGHDVCAHGFRGEKHYELDEDAERDRIRDTVESIRESIGARPLGWYCRYGPSLNTRRLLVEEGGFLYDSDSYADELPFWVREGGSPTWWCRTLSPPTTPSSCEEASLPARSSTNSCATRSKSCSPGEQLRRR